MKPESWSSSQLVTHLRNCKVNPKLGYTVWTVEAAYPPEDPPESPNGLKPRVGRVYGSLFNDGSEIQLDKDSARRFLALVILTGAPCESWVTAYDDAPDTEDDPGFELKDSEGRTIITSPAYAGRLWTFGEVGGEGPDIEIAEWSQNDVGSVSYFSSPHGAFVHVI